MTFAEFIRRYRVRWEIQHIAVAGCWLYRPPEYLEKACREFEQQHHYRVSIWCGERGPFVTEFHTGPAWDRLPTLEEVLEVLAADAELADAYRTLGFEAYARDMGINPDSRDAERRWQLTVSQTDHLRSVFGQAYDELKACRE